MELEYSLIRVPFERLSNVFKNSTRSIEKDLAQALQAISQLTSTERKDISRQDASALIAKLLPRLEALKRKLDEVVRQEEQFLDSLKTRMNCLQKYQQLSQNATRMDQAACAAEIRFQEERLTRILIDHMLRNDMWDSASLLAKQSNMMDFVQVDLYITKAKKAISKLKEKDTQEALKFCILNRGRLKKLNNLLEVELRIQEFAQLVELGLASDALKFAQNQLLTTASEYNNGIDRVKRAMCLLAFVSRPDAAIWKEFLSGERWEFLICSFRACFHQLYGITTESPLQLTLECGLAAMKTPACSDPTNWNINCPTCNPDGSRLSRDLPCAMHAHSTLVCSITGRLMDADNYPLVLPNGNVYSRDAIEEMVKLTGGITCPRTGEQFQPDQTRRAFIM